MIIKCIQLGRRSKKRCTREVDREKIKGIVILNQSLDKKAGLYWISLLLYKEEIIHGRNKLDISERTIKKGSREDV